MSIIISGHKGNIGSRLALCFDSYIGIDTQDGKDLLTCELSEEVDTIYHLAAHALSKKKFLLAILCIGMQILIFGIFFVG